MEQRIVATPAFFRTRIPIQHLVGAPMRDESGPSGQCWVQIWVCAGTDWNILAATMKMKRRSPESSDETEPTDSGWVGCTSLWLTCRGCLVPGSARRFSDADLADVLCPQPPPALRVDGQKAFVHLAVAPSAPSCSLAPFLAGGETQIIRNRSPPSTVPCTRCDCRA